MQHHGDAAPAPADGEAPQEAAVPAEQAHQPTPTAGEQVVAPGAEAGIIVPTAVIVEAPAPVAAEPVPAQAQAAAVATAAAPVAQPQTAGEQVVAPVATAAVAQASTEAKTPQAVVQAAVAAADEVELPVEAGAQPAAKQPTTAERNAATVAQNGASASQGHQQSANPNGSGKNDQPGTLPQQTADQARAVAQAYGRPAERRPAAAEAPAPQSQAAPVATPVAPAATANAAAARAVANATPVPLSRAAENVEHVLRLASSRGSTHARIALNPAELGSIDVHLRQTADGLVARVVAHAAEAVLQLQQAGDDLRRSLEQQGVNLLSLDIGQSGDERAAGRAGTFGDDDSGARNGRGESADGASEGDAEVTTKTTLQLPNGVLVDVLA